MTDIDRIRVTWNGFQGAPGLSTFYATSAPDFLHVVQTFFEALVAAVPSDVVMQIENSGDTISAETGALTGAWSGTPVAAINGTGPGPYSAPAGLQVKWVTGAIHAGHRVVGRTYIVPGSRDAFAGDGKLNPSVLSDVQAAGAVMVVASDGPMKIWSRPRVERPAYTDARGHHHPTLPAHDGVALSPASCVVPNKAVVLTSRRD